MVGVGIRAIFLGTSDIAYEECRGGVDVHAQIIDGTDIADEREGSLDSLPQGEAGFISLGELTGAGTDIAVTDVLRS